MINIDHFWTFLQTAFLLGFTCSLKTLIVADMRLLLVLYLGRCGAFDMPFLQEWKSFTRPQAWTDGSGNTDAVDLFPKYGLVTRLAKVIHLFEGGTVATALLIPCPLTES
ncbi:Uncharacterized protein HZ326_3734 [Fusarium oxysporum f. sp. albedinis]|jgi:hypothetical protein|nr:Uncharacterized protein HZ326_3734 [Fusarium oxysporum f. sp. albedinis]